MGSVFELNKAGYGLGAHDALKVARAILEDGKELDEQTCTCIVNGMEVCYTSWSEDREDNVNNLIMKLTSRPKVGDVVRATRDNKWNFIVLITESQAAELAGIILKDESNYEGIPTQLGRSHKGEHILLDSPNLIPYNVEVINHFSAFSHVMEDYEKALSDSVYAVMKEL